MRGWRVPRSEPRATKSEDDRRGFGGGTLRHAICCKPRCPRAAVSVRRWRESRSPVYQIQSALPSVPRRRCLVAALLGCAVALVLVNGCVSQMTCESPLDPCVQSGGPAEAAVTAAAAGALWVGGGGC